MGKTATTFGVFKEFLGFQRSDPNPFRSPQAAANSGFRNTMDPYSPPLPQDGASRPCVGRVIVESLRHNPPLQWHKSFEALFSPNPQVDEPMAVGRGPVECGGCP